MKKLLLSALLLLSCLCLVGCQLTDELQTALTDGALALVSEKAEETHADALTRQFLDGVLAGDAEACLAAMTELVTPEDMQAALPQMQALLPEADSYVLTPMHFSFNTRGDVTRSTFQFKLEIGGKYFLVQTQQVSTEDRLRNINITPAAADGWDVAKAESEPSPLWTLLSLLLSLASLAITLWALVHCIRHPMKRKWLWLLLVILGSVMLTLTLNGSQLSFRLKFGLYLVSSQIVPQAGGIALKLVLPIGPIVYLARRKALTAQPQTASDEAFAPAESDAASEQTEEHEAEDA